MGFSRLALVVLSSALVLGACAKGRTDVDSGPGGDSDAGGPRPDARPGGRIDAGPNTEVCDGMDNDADTFIDEGDLCTDTIDGTGRCNGLLGCVIDTCNEGFYDVDGEYSTGCECMGDALETEADTCAGARDLGDIPDTNQFIEIIGNIVPETDEDWYRFRAVDSPDAVCDTFHVRAQFLVNPDDQYVVDVWRGGCGMEQVCDGGKDLQWYTNFSAAGVGECPCGPTATNHCDDDTAEYHVRVRRGGAAALTCATYTLEISNGKYPAP